MKKRDKKLLSYLLALVLVMGIVPWISLTAKADNPIVISIVDATAEDRAYEPGNKNVTISYVTFKDYKDGHLLPLMKGRDYEVTGIMKDDKVGENKLVDVTVTLKNTTEYTLRNSTATTKVNITKATPPTGDFAFTEPTGSVDMFRLYNPNTGEHFYTGNEGEKDHLVSLGWNFEGIAFFVYDAESGQGNPEYRVYNPNTGAHHWTSDAAEKDALVALGWNDEGVAWNVK